MIFKQYWIYSQYWVNVPHFQQTKIIIFIAIVVFFCIMIQLEYDNAILSTMIQNTQEDHEIENFTNRQNDIRSIKTNINYAQSTDAITLFSNSPYLNTMNDLNSLARSLTKDSLVPFYKSSFQDITVLEEKIYHQIHRSIFK